MTSNNSQPPLVFPNFKAEDGNASDPEEFLRFLNNLTAQHLNSPSAAKQYPKETWVTIMMTLTNNVLSSFPIPQAMAWNTLAEKIHLVQATVEIIYRVFTQVEDIYRDSKDSIKKVFSRLLDICFVLDLWMEVEAVVEPGLASPSHLREKVMNTLVEVLRGLGNATSSSEARDAYDMLRQLALEILSVNQSLTSSATPFSFPVSIKWFNQDRIEELKDNTILSQEDGGCNVILDSVTQIPIFLATALQASLMVYFQTLSSQLLLLDIQLSLLEGLKTLFDYCLSPSSSATNACRSRVLSRILQLHRHVITSSAVPEAAQTFCYIATRLLQARMEGLLRVDARILDDSIRAYMESFPQQGARSLVIQASNVLKDDTHEDADTMSLAASYLRSCIGNADEDIHLLIKSELHQCTNPEVASIQAKIHESAKALAVTHPIATQAAPNKLPMKEHVWRREIKTLVQTIISPYPLAWMDDDFRPNETHFIRRVLNDINDRFSGPLEKTDEGSRLELVSRLAHLPCLLTLCSGEDCFAFRKLDGFSMVHLYLPAIEALLQGPANEVTNAVRRGVFKTLCPILRHRNEEEPGPQTMDLIFRGLGDKDRSTRLQAGSALYSVLQLYARITVAARIPTTPIFDRVYQQIEIGKGPIKETLIVSIAKMGSTTNQELLGNVVSLLVAQLGRSNILIRSLACTQILSVARQHKKTPYSLILPYLDQVAPFVVSRLASEPTLLQEICKLMSISPVDFLSINLPRTLPDLLVRCDAQGLDVIAKYLERDRHSLIVGENIHLHLAPIFLLRSPTSTNKAISFILGILNEASRTKIDLRQVLPGCTTALLTELIVMMGDNNPSVTASAVAAIQKVETALRTGNSRPSQASDPGAFLASQMLGIISRIIDMLQDVHGKKSVSAKQKILRSLGALIVLIGPPIHSVSSQIMATFQTMISVPELSEVTIESWHKFLTTMGPLEIGPHLGATCAAFISSWPNFSQHSRQVVCDSLHHTLFQSAKDLSQYLDEIVDLSVVDKLKPLQEHLNALRGHNKPQDILYPLLARCASNNITVATLSLSELRRLLQIEHRSYVQSLASGDVFESSIGRVLSTLYKAACRDGEGTENLRVLAYECIGVLGAVDPYRFEMPSTESDMVVTKNFTEEGETMAFILHLIQDLLVDAFRSTSDIKYQTNLAYPIQELLKHCGFSSDLVNSGRSAPMKIRNRWNSLSKDVLDVITPLLEGRFTFNQHLNANILIPVYPTQSTYREWLQLWATYLISKASGKDAQKIFRVFLSVIRSKDVVIAKHLLPHLVLNILISGDSTDAQNIRDEILVVLMDQVNADSTSTTDKKLLSAQAIFALLDHLNRWARVVRRDLGKKKAESKRARASHISFDVEDQLVRLDSILSSIDQNLMARAAFQCKAYARSLMSFEQQMLTLQQQGKTHLEEYYDRIHEIYAHLDEPDGMEGVSSLILSPSLEHQIREHESTGKWTAAQSCWEVRLQHSPDNLDFHLGLLRCLRNLGHYDTLRNHVKGVLTNHAEWESALADFHVESSWMVGAWDDIESLLGRIDVQTPAVVLAKVLLAMRGNNLDEVSSSLATARRIIGAPITASGVDGYRRTYNSALNLHMTHELELIYDISRNIPGSHSLRRKALSGLSNVLASRLDSTLPTFRCREPILSMRRIGYSLMPSSHPELVGEVGSTWLASAKIARKAGHWQTAYSAMLQARQNDASLYFIESAKLTKAGGEPLKALQELETFMKSLGLTEDSPVLDLTLDEEMIGKVKGKLYLLRARWMNESERYEATSILEAFRTANELDKKMESSHFYFGNFYDKCYKELKPGDILKRGIKMIMYTVRNYARAIRFGSKYIYQTVPRLLTLWLDNGEDKVVSGTDVFNKINDIVATAIKEIPAYKWFTAFPQIVSRVGHNADKVYNLLAQLIVGILQEYPQQALWLFASVVRSTKPQRETRGRAILEKLRSTPSSNKKLARFIADSVSMTNELLALCDRPVDDEKKTLSMARDFPRLRALGHCELLIPLQESLTANLPSSSSAEAAHQPFLLDAPTFNEFADEIEIMKSMAKPRKITINGSDGQIYMFLGKPKDDLRKDARLMDFNSIINKLLKTNSDARRRQLHIRTYGVVTLNEECGFIQWVPNTIPVRPVLLKYYDARRIRNWSGEMGDIFRRIKEVSDHAGAELFVAKILPLFPPVFHEWFIETFPEPSAWLASRLSFGRTAAVMSMVGYILGLGDRHCENILLDVNTGDVIHVDFNCLFEKGKNLETPERVPFRLTQNIVDGLGISGVEGVFRIACELTMTLLRENKDSLMSVLDAFVHDPLVEWEDEKRKRDRSRNQPRTSTESIAKTALEPIGSKLEGYYDVTKAKHEQTRKLLSTNNLVESLIQEARSEQNLAKMYPGWAAWY